MVRKITSGEYLKRYNSMTAAERSAYLDRVGDWLAGGAKSLAAKGDTFEARLQDVLTASLAWNSDECLAFEQGAVLMSALVGLADTKLPDLLYAISAKRSVRKMTEVLREVRKASGRTETMPANAAGKPKEEPAEGTAKATQAVGGKAAGDGLHTDSVRMQAGEAKEAVIPFRADAGDGGVPGGGQDGETEVTAVPARPKHIDQYVHLLPQKTQERAAQVKGLLREMDEAREKMRLLADDPTAKDDDRAAWAKKATSIDNKVRRIYDELDSEWNKLVKSGRVVVDDLGNARVVDEAKGGEAESEEPADTKEEPEGLTSGQRARRRELRKWLIDTRRGNGNTRATHTEKWHKAFREYLTLEGDAAYGDDKILEAAKHYGIDLGTFKEEQPSQT